MKHNKRKPLTDLSNTLIDRGNALSKLGKFDAAVRRYDEGVAIYRRLVEQEGHAELAHELSRWPEVSAQLQ